MLGESTLGIAAPASLFESKTLAEPGIRKTPNIVFILIDEAGHKDLACCGSKLYQTPNIDQLAAEGMRSTRAYSACRVCSPSRVAIFSGKYPARTQLTNVAFGPLYEKLIVYYI
ncbi:MAG: sulfatase-like hydrolase/transferase, partial [Planctomycetota bacterium]